MQIMQHDKYLTAWRRFTSGEIPAVQAVGLIQSDEDWVAEAELRGLDKEARRELAWDLVLHHWRREAVQRMARSAA
jgi:hypothetical protein